MKDLENDCPLVSLTYPEDDDAACVCLWCNNRAIPQGEKALRIAGCHECTDAFLCRDCIAAAHEVLRTS